MGAGHSHLVDHGPGQHARAERLLGHEGGAVGLAKASALDLGAFNITVNCIAPARLPPRCPCRSSARDSRLPWPPERP